VFECWIGVGGRRAVRGAVRGRGENQHKLNDVTESVDQRSNGASRPFYFPEKKIQNKLTVQT